MIGFGLLPALFIWIICILWEDGLLMMIKEKERVEILAWFFLILGVLIGVLGFSYRYYYENPLTSQARSLFSFLLSDLYSNVALTFFNMGFVVLVIDKLNKQREKREAERQKRIDVIRQLGSQSRVITYEAIQQARDMELLVDGSLRGRSFVRADWTEAHLEYADLEGVDLRDANLAGVWFQEVKLRGADLRSANLEGAQLEAAHLEGAHLTNQLFADKWWGGNMFAANLMRADLTKAHLEGANLEGADLSFASLQSACLKGANLRNAQLECASLENADFTNVCLDGACLTGARYNYQTIPPDGFDFRAAGAVLVANEAMLE